MKNKILQIFASHFIGDPIIIRSPGRVNIIGEHTDYNHGFVLPAAIDKAAYLAVCLREDDEIHLIAHDLNEAFAIKASELRPVGDISWPNFILGAVFQFHKKAIPVRGFNAVLMSDVPIGAGLSSSAAIECATTFALNELFKSRLSRLEMVNMAQAAEHEFAGVKCGIMDQFASVMGKKDHVIKLDCHSLEYDYIPFRLDGIKILLLNTNVKHSLASSEYNTRRQECEQGVEWIKKFEPEVNSLRDVSIAMLNKYVLTMDTTVDSRCRFIVQEIARLKAACDDLLRNDIAGLGDKMFATHKGLQLQYEVSCKELDFLVDFLLEDQDVIGARMMGGGFGGCTINLVRENAVDRILSLVQPAYEAATNLPLSHYVASIENGTEMLL